MIFVFFSSFCPSIYLPFSNASRSHPERHYTMFVVLNNDRKRGSYRAYNGNPRLCLIFLRIINLYSIIYRDIKFAQNHPVLPFQLPFFYAAGACAPV